MKYKFKWRRKLFWNTRTVIGHQYLPDIDKIVLYFEDGSQEIIAHWKNCDQKLGVDWVLATKKRMEEEAGSPIPLKVNAGG